MSQTTASTTTQSGSLAREWAINESSKAVPRMTAAIKRVKIGSNAVVALGLCVTYTHQATFLSNIRHLEIFGWVVPAIWDIGMLAMLVQASTAGMNRVAVSRAMRVFFGLVLTGVLVNVVASHTWLERGIFAAIVLLVGAIKWATAPVGPDFRKMEVIENAIIESVTPVEEPRIVRRLTDEEKASRNATRAANAERRRWESLTPQQRAAETRRANAAAPVSPGTGIPLGVATQHG